MFNKILLTHAEKEPILRYAYGDSSQYSTTNNICPPFDKWRTYTAGASLSDDGRIVFSGVGNAGNSTHIPWNKKSPYMGIKIFGGEQLPTTNCVCVIVYYDRNAEQIGYSGTGMHTLDGVNYSNFTLGEISPGAAGDTTQTTAAEYLKSAWYISIILYRYDGEAYTDYDVSKVMIYDAAELGSPENVEYVDSNYSISPETPIPITDNILAGTYQISHSEDIYEITLPHNLRGFYRITSTERVQRDKLTVDFANEKAHILRRCNSVKLGGACAYAGTALYGKVYSTGTVAEKTDTKVLSFKNISPVILTKEESLSNGPITIDVLIYDTQFYSAAPWSATLSCDSLSDNLWTVSNLTADNMFSNFSKKNTFIIVRADNAEVIGYPPKGDEIRGYDWWYGAYTLPQKREPDIGACIIDYLTSSPVQYGDKLAARPVYDNIFCTHFCKSATVLTTGKHGDTICFPSDNDSRWYFALSNKSIVPGYNEMTEEEQSAYYNTTYPTVEEANWFGAQYMRPWFDMQIFKHNFPVEWVYMLKYPYTEYVTMTKVDASTAPILELTEE